MKISLYQRLALTLCSAFMIMAYLLVSWSNSLIQQSKYQAEQELHLHLAEHLAQDNPLLQDGVYDKPALENLFHTLMLLGPAFEFYFLDNQGNILTYSAKPEKIKRKSVSLAPINALINTPKNTPVFGDDPRDINHKKIFSAAPVYQGNALQGYLYVIIGGEIYDSIFTQIQADKVLQKYSAFFIASLILLLLVLLGIFHYFTRPVKVLASQMQALKLVNFDVSKVQLKQWGTESVYNNNPDELLHNEKAHKEKAHKKIAHNEVSFLGETFNDMAVQINKQLSLLTENDKTRRELLTHLSHDLRTPLATIQGYIETIAIKSEQLSEVERAEYLTTVQRSVYQLKRLIDQIFELAHLDNGQVKTDIEPFLIGEILYDILAKFHLKAEDKSITLRLQPEQCQYLVYSDMGKLERIITNLLENAIRHTDIGGEIIIHVTQLKSKMTISVIDNGSGISTKDITYVFDARYRASNAIEDKTQHTGLGLAISQKLAQVMNAELSVTSELGNGSCFALSIPMQE